MKKYTLLNLLLLLIFSTILSTTLWCQSVIIDFNQLEKREGLFYKMNDTLPFTGTVEKRLSYKQFENGTLVKKTSDTLLEWQKSFLNGKLHGVLIYWHENGKKRMEEHYNQGKQHGKITMWDQKGTTLSQGNYKNGKRHGSFTLWYANGKVRSKGAYHNGKRHGRISAWYKNGQKKLEYYFKEGVKHGPYLEWSKDGKIETRKSYENGKRKN